MQQANAVAVERGAEEARQQSSAQVEAERRRELKADADQSLENILALLDRQIKDAASSVRARADSSRKSWELNGATLSVDVPKPVKPGADRDLPFEVIAHTKISVSASADRSGHTGRSHSLWYCDAQEQGVFRWYETAFMETFGTNRPRSHLSPCPPTRRTLLQLYPQRCTPIKLLGRSCPSTKETRIASSSDGWAGSVKQPRASGKHHRH